MIKKLLQKKIHHLRRSLGLTFYQHSQTYKVAYQVKLQNNSDREKKFFLIIPGASDHQRQKISADVTYEPQKPFIQNDALYKNKYAIWQIKLAAGESSQLKQIFTITVKPTTFKENVNFRLSDYKNIQPEGKAEQKLFCTANRYVNGNDPEIQTIAKSILKNCSPLENGEIDLVPLVKKINAFVIEYLDYQNPIPGLYTYEQALHTRTVDCGGFDTFFASICNALGIPARVVCGFYAGHRQNGMHAWAEWMLPNGVWVPVDPSVEQLSKRGDTVPSGKFGFCGSDRITFSVGCDIPITLPTSNENTPTKTLQLDILQNPVLYPDDPMIKLDLSFITSPPSDSSIS